MSGFDDLLTPRAAIYQPERVRRMAKCEQACNLIVSIATDAGFSLTDRETTMARIAGEALGFEVIIKQPHEAPRRSRWWRR